MKLYSWNVNGVRAVAGKGLADILAAMDADVVCLQETKLSDDSQWPLADMAGYSLYMNHAVKKGYSGTAVLTRRQPLGVTRGMGRDEHDSEGRVITVEYDDFFLVNVYVPNSQNELKRLDYRMTWEDAFLDYVKGLDAVKPVVICGDLNVAHNDIDLKNPKTNHENPGFTDQERQAFGRLLEAGFVDTFRHLHPDTQTFSWWSYRYSARAKNIGWRIDYFLMSARMAGRLADAQIHTDILGSDHCPVSIIIE